MLVLVLALVQAPALVLVLVLVLVQVRCWCWCGSDVVLVPVLGRVRSRRAAASSTDSTDRGGRIAATISSSLGACRIRTGAVHIGIMDQLLQMKPDARRFMLGGISMVMSLVSFSVCASAQYK